MVEGAHSPSSRRKSPPHVVFMVDTHMTSSADLPHRDQAARIRFGILRILLYFHTCVDRRMTWGYQFFDSENSSSTLRMQNHFQELSTSSLDAFLKALNGEIDISSQRQLDKAMNTNDNETPFTRLKQALVQAQSDFQWTEIDFAYLASPGRLRRTPRSMRQMKNGPVEIRNHIYIVSSIPQTYNDIMWYFQSRSESAVQTHLTREGDKMTIVKLMDNVAMELKKTLWEGFVDHRISLNWVDIGDLKLDESLPEDKVNKLFGVLFVCIDDVLIFDQDVREFIGLAFHAIAQIFGGHLIPLTILQPELTEQFGYSVQSILNHYTSKTINTSNDFVRSKKVATNMNKPTLLDEIQKYQMECKESWRGELILGDEHTTNEDQLPIKFRLLVHNFLRSQWSHTLVDLSDTKVGNSPSIEHTFANISSMTVFLQLPVAAIPLKWYQTTEDTKRKTTNKNLFLCTLEHTEDMKMMIEFETLLSKLNDNQYVLIVRLEYRDSAETSCKYAAIEPIAYSSATLGFLDCEAEDLLACAMFHTSVDPYHRMYGSNLFDPWARESFEDNAEEHFQLYEIECDLPKELEVAIVADSDLQSTTAREGESAIITAIEALNTDNPVASLEIDVKEDKPDSLEELQSTWISLYLQSLYLSTIEPEAIARQFQLWVSHLEHNMYIQVSTVHGGGTGCVPSRNGDLLSRNDELLSLTDELAKHLVEDEDQVLEKWKKIRPLDTKILRMIKIKDAQLQIIVMLKIMELEKRFMTLNKIELPKPQKKRKKKKKLSAEDFEQQLELYFDRLCIWDSMMDITNVTETSKANVGKNGPESSAMNLKTLCKNLSDIYRPILPDIIDKLWSRCGGEEEPLQLEMDRSLSAGSAKDSAPEKGTVRTSRSKPMDMDARVKLLESRIRGPSTETMVTDAIWATQSDKKVAQQPSASISLLSGTRRHTASTINLPFMKREIEMTKSLNVSSKTKHAASTSAPSRTTGSRRKIAVPRKITMAVTGGENTETVVLRKRQVFSPTTPRTRAERDFGLRLARTPTNAPLDVPTAAKRSTETIDGPVTSSPRKLMRTFSGSRSPSAQRHKSLPMSRMRLSPNSPSHNRIKQTRPTDLSSIMPKRDLFSSFLQASGSEEDQNKL
ncbi:hypothetical protein INT43_004939 [Umbelopsis isabellina]|uniref:DNA replication regulator Sld3 C-terminal domain-containing protein n=1 Tax=Mortierella isabellina TaxID=91625 RepID=A0A8H7PEE3_MORIS|nr:hypothetical protein INT43_004939 [Umbelopsis isabellina]